MDKERKYKFELKEIAQRISRILKDNFVGFYVMGSFVMGDWDPEKSDIDFIVITEKPLNKRESLELGKLHKVSLKSDFGKKLEGAYAYLEQLQQKRFEEKTGSFEDHEFKADCSCHLSADNILCLLEYGKCIQGMPIRELGLSVSAVELSQAACDMLLEDMKETDKKEDFQTLYYILIDMLRCIYTLETEKLPTKPKAIEYCRNLAGKDLYENIKAFREGKIEEFAINKNDINRIASYSLRKNLGLG